MDAEAKLLTGVYNLFTADADSGGIYDAVSGLLYEDEAPENANRPFLVYEVVDHEADWTFDTEFEEFLLMFSCHADTKTTALSLKNKLTTLFDDASPTVTGYVVESFFRESSRGFKEEDWYISEVEYRIRLQKS